MVSFIWIKINVGALFFQRLELNLEFHMQIWFRIAFSINLTVYKNNRLEVRSKLSDRTQYKTTK